MSNEEVVRFDSEPIVGWRAWRVCYEEDLPSSLESIAQPVRWPARKPIRAHCLYAWRRRRPWTQHAFLSHGQTPALQHSCGIYAARTTDQARAWSSHFALEAHDQRVIGRVALWGRVLVHSAGWRAELAYPNEFVVPPKLDGDLDPEALAFWLEARYGVPARVRDDLWRRSFSAAPWIRPLRRLRRLRP